LTVCLNKKAEPKTFGKTCTIFQTNILNGRVPTLASQNFKNIAAGIRNPVYLDRLKPNNLFLTSM